MRAERQGGLPGPVRLAAPVQVPVQTPVQVPQAAQPRPHRPGHEHKHKHEHEFEAAPGLPEALPAGEDLLWQGRPQALALARQLFWLDGVALYFGVLLVWRLAEGLAAGQSLGTALAATALLLPGVTLALGLLGGLAWLTARSSVYTLTSRRVVMRLGIVLCVTYNLPLHCLAAADLRRRRGGTGDIALRLADGEHIAYLQLWPHVRPWRLRRPEPMLRALPDAEALAQRLVQTWSAQREAQHGLSQALQASQLQALGAVRRPLPQRAAA